MSGMTITQLIERYTNALITGQCGLQDLPPAIAALYNLGYAEGQQVAQRKIRDLEHECDRLYLLGTAPKQRQAEYLARLQTMYEHDAHE